MPAVLPDDANPALQRYALTRPTAEEAVAGLTRVIGRDRAVRLWQRCCATAGVDPDHVSSLAELMKVGACMCTLPGPEGVMGASLCLRIGTYQALAASTAPGRDGGSP